MYYSFVSLRCTLPMFLFLFSSCFRPESYNFCVFLLCFTYVFSTFLFFFLFNPFYLSCGSLSLFLPFLFCSLTYFFLCFYVLCFPYIFLLDPFYSFFHYPLFFLLFSSFIFHSLFMLFFRGSSFHSCLFLFI